MKWDVCCFPFKNFAAVFAINYFFCFFSRTVETVLLYFFQSPPKLWIYEAIGLMSDVFLFSLALMIIYFLVIILGLSQKKYTLNTFMWLSIVFWVLHFLILPYYIIEFKPLDIFLFHYSLEEILFTIRTAGLNLFFWLILSFSPILFTFILRKKIFFNRFTIAYNYLLLVFLVSIPGFLGHIILFRCGDANDMIKNKSMYFYGRCCKYLTSPSSDSIFSASTINDYRKSFADKAYLSSEYPFLHKAETKSQLADFFQKTGTAPTIVILIVEGLSNRFVNPIENIHFMPFLDSLKDQSLYWDHFLTTGERSFAVVPSLLGSLPYGTKGFTFLEKIPHHFNLVNVLRSNRYYASYFYGQGAWVHNKDRYFLMNDIDLIFDKNKFSPRYTRVITGKDNYFWGYDDKDLFNQYTEVSDSLPSQRRLDILFTGTMHPPFAITDETYYNKRFESLLEHIKDPKKRNYFNTYRKYFLALLFTDDAIKSFFEKIRYRKEFLNTIFIITGDHPMTEIPRGNSLKRYHVPLIMYSALLRKTGVFHGVGSHLDIYEPLLGLMHQNFGLHIPRYSSAISNSIRIDSFFNCVKSVVFMNDNREMVDFFHNGYFLSNGKDLFKVDNDFNLSAIKDKKLLDSLVRSLDLFKRINLYSCLADKLMPDSLYYQGLEKKILYAENRKTIKATGDEYLNITPRAKVQNTNMSMDISFTMQAPSKDLPAGVFQLKTNQDSLILWQSFQIPTDKKQHQYHILLNKQNVSQDSLNFQFFFWNQKHSRVGIRDFNLILAE